MPETLDHRDPFVEHWRNGLTILNLRGSAQDAAFVDAAQAVLGVALPTEPCRTCEADGLRVVWAGPDDWFIIWPAARAGALMQWLREALAGVHAAVTDVSSGYAVLRVSGTPVRDVLAQGCPLDLHPRAFHLGQAVGTHYFKATVWLWQVNPTPVFEMLVRRSFRDYVALMLERSTRECGLQAG
jgi:sarcosine oxidase, subunit gamma